MGMVLDLYIYSRFVFRVSVMFIGVFSGGIFFKSASIVTCLTITLIYFIAQHYHHEQKIAWISACAAHYPQFLVFRIATITGAFFLVLGWMTNYFYLRTISKQHGLNIKQYRPQISMILGMMGGMLLMGSTAQIDTGQHSSKVHGFCATMFFVFSIVAILYNQVISWIIYRKTKALNRLRMILKTLVSVLMVVQFVINTFFAVGEGDGVGSKLGIFIEWSASYTVMTYFYLLAKDCDQFDFCYDQIRKE